MITDKLIKKRCIEEETRWFYYTTDEYDNRKYYLIKDYKLLTHTIVNIMGMYKDGEIIYYETSEGVQSCSANKYILSEVLMMHLYEFVPVDINVWTRIASNIKGFIPTAKQNDRYIVFNNTAIDLIKTKESKKFVFVDPLKQIDNKFNYNFIEDPNKLNKKALALFKSILDNYTADIKSDKEKQEWIQELLKITGYLLAPSNWLEKVFIFRSKPGAGKSLWLNILQKIYSGNAAPYQPQAQDQFAEAGIYKKRFIFTGELRGGKWTRQNEIQQLASGETFSIRMNGGRMVTWRNPRVQMLFLTNKNLTADKGDGIWDRFHLFEFKTKIRGTHLSGEHTIKQKTSSKAFIEVFIHFAINALADVIRGGLKPDLGLINKELNSQNNVLEFLKNIISKEIKVNMVIKPGNLFKKYNGWKLDEGIKNDNLTKKEFTENLKEYILSQGYPKPRNLNNVTTHAWDLSYVKYELKEKFNEPDHHILSSEEEALEKEANYQNIEVED